MPRKATHKKPASAIDQYSGCLHACSCSEKLMDVLKKEIDKLSNKQSRAKEGAMTLGVKLKVAKAEMKSAKVSLKEKASKGNQSKYERAVAKVDKLTEQHQLASAELVTIKSDQQAKKAMLIYQLGKQKAMTSFEKDWKKSQMKGANKMKRTRKAKTMSAASAA